MRLRNSEQALKELPGPVTARISKERGRGGREGEDRRRGREREREGREDAKQFILGPPFVFSFGIGEMQRCFLQRMHYFSLRGYGSIMFVSFIKRALCGRHSFRGTL